MSILNYLQLLLYPFLQVVCFFLFVILVDFSYWSFVLVIPSAFFLNFTLHISVHHFVHFPFKNPFISFLAGLVNTFLIGLPFHYYEMSHWNHHRYNNGLEDFTTTWAINNGKRTPKSFWMYCFLWIIVAPKELIRQFQVGMKEGYFTKTKMRLMIVDYVCINVLFWALGYWNFLVLFGYLLTIYLAWVFISAQNYGQHLPDFYQKHKGYSYYSKLYNLIFANNGLHEEHHNFPQRNYWELNVEKTESELKNPHLISGLQFKKREL